MVGVILGFYQYPVQFQSTHLMEMNCGKIGGQAFSMQSSAR